MAATPESKVKKEIKAVLDARESDCWYFMPAANGYGMSGVPDFVGCFRGRFFAIEAKAEKGRVSVYQQRVLKEILNAYGEVEVCHSKDEAVEFLDRFL